MLSHSGTYLGWGTGPDVYLAGVRRDIAATCVPTSTGGRLATEGRGLTHLAFAVTGCQWVLVLYANYAGVVGRDWPFYSDGLLTEEVTVDSGLSVGTVILRASLLSSRPSLSAGITPPNSL